MNIDNLKESCSQQQPYTKEECDKLSEQSKQIERHFRKKEFKERCLIRKNAIKKLKTELIKHHIEYDITEPICDAYWNEVTEIIAFFIFENTNDFGTF